MAESVRPRRGDVITITHVHERKSYGTAIRVGSVQVQHDGSFTMTGIVEAGPRQLEGIDARLDNQRQSITRLSEHLAKHCPQLAGEGMCPHIG